MLKNLINGFLAGVLISIGGSVFLACDNKVVGSALFAVALLCICMLGYNLFTGKICYIVESHSKSDFSRLLLGILGNLIGTVICGYAIRYAIPSLGETAFTICSSKLNQPFFSTLIRGIFCGILIYLAVELFRSKKTISGIIFCIPVFILSGFEHSIADMFYFATSGIVSLKALSFIWTVILGNTIGGMFIPFFSLIGGKEHEKS